MSHFKTSLLLVCIVAAKYTSAQSNLIVNTTSGIFEGNTAESGLERWLGIPYAQPPVGGLRFKAPVPVTDPAPDVKQALEFGDACPQPGANLGAPISEDCLYLNIYRPEGTNSSANLPILVFIHGGQWTNGAASEYDPNRIIPRAVSNGKPIMFAAMNYRLNAFGFAASRFIPVEDLDMGLQDQRLALEFIQNNIAAFGGDPEKVTIWGQSAGAGSVEAHVIYYASQPLFRGAMCDSLTGPFKSAPYPYQYDEAGKPFARLTEATGCPLSDDSISCLQQVPFEKLLNISNDFIAETVNGQTWEPTVGGPGSFADERASARIAKGEFLHVPFLAGTNLNEGSRFCVDVLNVTHPGLTEDEALDQFIGELILDNSTLTRDVLEKINSLYPANDSILDAPYNTGDSLFDRAAAFYGDNMFHAARRLFFDKAADIQPLFGYHFTEFIPGNNITFGVAHASELPLLFGPVPAVEEDFANKMLDFYINFITDLDPGAPWPRFTSERKLILQLLRDNITAIPDTFDLLETTFLNSPEVLNEFEK